MVLSSKGEAIKWQRMDARADASLIPRKTARIHLFGRSDSRCETLFPSAIASCYRRIVSDVAKISEREAIADVSQNIPPKTRS